MATTYLYTLQYPLLIFFLLSALLIYIYRKALPHPLPGIPHHIASRNRLTGDIPALAAHKIATGEILDWFTAQTYILHSPLVQIFVGPFRAPTLILNDFRETEDMLTRRTKEFDRSPLTTAFFNGFIPQSSIVMPSHELFKEQRRMWAGTMTTEFLHTVSAPSILKSCQELVELWARKTRLAEGAPFQADKDLRHMTLDAVWALALGSELGSLPAQLDAVQSVKSSSLARDELGAVVMPEAQPNDVAAATTTLLQSLEKVVASPFPGIARIVLSYMPYMRRAKKLKDDTCRQLIVEARAKFAENDGRDAKATCAMELVLSREAASIEKTGHASAVSEEEAMMDELFMFVIAGHETTATTLSWGVKYLSRHPTLQSSLRTALLTAYGTHTPTLSQILHTSIPLLDATAHEMLRLSRTVSAAVRVATVDTQILGHRIPAGNSVIMLLNGWSSLGSGDFEVDEGARWTEKEKEKVKRWEESDIGHFRPEWWLVPDASSAVAGRAAVMVFDANAGPSLPMSAGPRGCFGKRLAHLELRLAIVTLVLAFEFLGVPEALDSDGATEVVTRQPDGCFVRLMAVV